MNHNPYGFPHGMLMPEVGPGSHIPDAILRPVKPEIALPNPNEEKSFEPQTQPLVPLIDDNRQVTLTLIVDGAAEFSIARKKFPRPRACTVYVNAYRQDGAPGLFAPNTFAGGVELWMLGTLRYGTGAVTHTVTFDIPLGREIAIPLVAENIEVVGRLIGGQQGDPNGYIVAPGYGQSLFTYPPTLPGGGLTGPGLPPGGLSNTFGGIVNIGQEPLASPVNVSGFVSEETPNGPGTSVYRAYRIHFLAGGTRPAPIALGAASVSVNGDPSGGGSWAFVIYDGNTGVAGQSQDYPFNADPIAIPDNALAINVTSGVGGANTGYVNVIEYMGI